jgi:tetratricopeptide (TPR) repeat protein
MLRTFAATVVLLAISGPAGADTLSDCTQGTGDAGISACTRVLQSPSLSRPDRLRALNARGILWKQKGDYDRAIADYTAALALNPGYVFAYYNRANSHHEKRDFERAIDDYTQAIRINPKLAQAYNNRGTVYGDLNDFDRAIPDYDTAIRLDPKYAAAYNNRGVAWKNKGRYDRAIADYDAAIRLDPTYASAYSNRGVAYRSKGDTDRALAEYEKALRLAPGDPEIYNNRGVSFGDSGDLQRAIADYSEALRLNPRYLQALTNRAFTHEKNGAMRDALADFHAAVAIDPSRRELEQDIRRLEQKLARPPIQAPQPPQPKPAPAPGRERRIALVVGNGAYAHGGALANPRNDAADITGSLRKLGFETIAGYDLDRREMENKIREFGRRAASADLALFYYAGHGLQVASRNYLVPIDARLDREADLAFEALDLDLVLGQMTAGSRANLLFLDACRNNPLARDLSERMGLRSAAVGAGLASVDGGIGTLIVYATQPNNVALDGAGRNSPFTAALLTHLPVPGVDIGVMLRRVRADVIRATNRQQVPWDHSSLIGDIVLARE